MTLATRISAFLNPPQPAEVAVVEQKAGLGPGAYVLEYHEPLEKHRRNTQKWMRYAQTVSRKNPWVNTAEGIICSKLSTVPWHLEDANGDTIDPDNAGPATSALQVIEHPNPMMTRSKLWNITLRHMGVCGNAFWYLDQRDALAGTPLAIYYINPARIAPATDKAGNLTGWILDPEDTYTFDYGELKGTPLDLDEVIHFTLEPPDWGYLGHGLVEAAENLIVLEQASERYMTQVLASGGRRGHFIGPKEGRLDDDVFQALVTGLRNVAESPDAAKRNIVVKGPIETTPQALNPTEIGAVSIFTEMREDIVSGVWRVPLSQLGVPLPAGLNSGDSRKWEEAALWQNAIEPRGKTFAETVQFQLLDRWKRMGLTVNLVLETPAFDDALPAWELLEKSKDAAVTWNEQRALVGLDPLPDYDAAGNPLGIRITMSDKIVTVANGIDEAGVAPAFEEPEPDPVPLVSSVSRPLLEPGTPVKAAPLGDLRTTLENTVKPKMQAALTSFLASQRDETIERLRARVGHLLRSPGDFDAWWPKTWDDRLAAVLQPHLATVATDVGGEVQGFLGRPQKADGFLSRIRQFILARTGERITGINETTRTEILSAVKDVIREATAEGWSPAKTADALSDRVKELTAWNDARATLISRTELMNAYNDAALHSYENFEVRQVEALDGDKDAECADRNGKRYPIDEAYGIADHPNGTLDWIPVIPERSGIVVRDLAA